jgi:hypothetical protein
MPYMLCGGGKMRTLSLLKSLVLTALIFFIVGGALAQTDSERAEWITSRVDESKLANAANANRILKFNFGPLWSRLNDDDSVLGYIGDNYQRLRVVILSANKRADQPDTYDVTGKSMVKTVVRSFSGTMRITKIASTPASELDDDYKSEPIREAGVVFGEYHFSEDSKQTNTGKFDGVFVTDFVVDKSGRLRYDEVLAGADGYSNNQFLGTWTSYRAKIGKPASWGDSRIPLSGDLDIGAGEFSPDDKYVVNGWQSYRDAYTNQNKRALIQERRQWWK